MRPSTKLNVDGDAVAMENLTVDEKVNGGKARGVTMKTIGSDVINRRTCVGLLLVWLILVVLSATALGQTGGPYQLSWTTIDGGGGQSRGGDYVLTGTIGQPDADWSSGGGYEVLGGFWPGGPLCFVGFDDFARFAQMWLIDDLAGDLDGDNDIDFGDVGELADNWLLYCPYNWPLR